ncbi:siderophore ABC transporter substrate-binding protein [Massilia sp. BSC265]|uniref:siderophore ABC transporter substrate-binding protein n=1 Tax=Massilia sp. BSC265 TaxID=1549812 RepID=UPI0004E97D14|nr:ABC transporter substrate-binding protein [Massilia sp. BSC265]KFI08891.1 hypothetical protein JN27_01720 [Massilia sp. BSC265]
MKRGLQIALGVLFAAMVTGAVGSAWLAMHAAPTGPAAHSDKPDLNGRRIAHAQGVTLIPHEPVKVAVLDPSALDIADALGIKPAGVAGDAFPGHLAKYAGTEYPRLGTLFEPDFEQIHAMGFDLVITGGRSSAKFQAVSAIAPTIDMRENDAQPLQGIVSNVLMLGSVFKRETAAQELVARLTRNVAALHAKTHSRGTGLIVLVSGGRMSAYGPGSRFGMIHTDFGVPPAVTTLAKSLHGEAISAEFIMKVNPDWLFVIDRDAAIGERGAARQVLDNALVRRTTAWTKGQVLYLDPVNIYLVGNGIQSIEALVREISLAYDHVR